jgi:hypothetical protein
VATTLWKRLVLEHDGVGAGAFQQLDRATGIDRVAETGVRIGQYRDADGIPHGGDVSRELGDRDEACVRHPKGAVGHGGTAHHQHSVARALDHACRQGVARPRHDVPGTRHEFAAHPFVERFVHRILTLHYALPAGS